jgi:hypothetical protein
MTTSILRNEVAALMAERDVLHARSAMSALWPEADDE